MENKPKKQEQPIVINSDTRSYCRIELGDVAVETAQSYNGNSQQSVQMLVDIIAQLQSNKILESIKRKAPEYVK